MVIRHVRQTCAVSTLDAIGSRLQLVLIVDDAAIIVCTMQHRLQLILGLAGGNGQAGFVYSWKLAEPTRSVKN